MKTDAPSGSSDGRRKRGEDNRARIVAAMLEIVQSGEVAPSAEQVAARADVGLRTVFRHFSDMDSLYREMSEAIEIEVKAVADQPFKAPDWRGRVLELVGRRGVAFEKIGPFRKASDAFRHRSRFLGDDADRLSQRLREILERVVADAVDRQTLEALDLLLSFEAWSRLREEQGLSVDQTQAVLETAARRLIA
ncbi:MAG: TetR/AcrR family transcriptional regulator [Phenylobacterium sp.]|nr:TetR/AcrR family transcriptional regulator [Phenylobacterium sp.]MBP9231337.1 TetR/AcrR family transcriptional regulator [Phenylobacterium sp.]MBP9754627.1 TetR/AcrR family transcriptional regulator [Phenylobacterium sp.]